MIEEVFSVRSAKKPFAHSGFYTKIDFIGLANDIDFAGTASKDGDSIYCRQVTLSTHLSLVNIRVSLFKRSHSNDLVVIFRVWN